MNTENIRNVLENRIRYMAGDSTHYNNFESHLYFKIMCDVINFYKQFYDLDLYDIFTSMIDTQKSTADGLTIVALELKHRGQLEAARIILERACKLDKTRHYIPTLAAELLREEGLLSEARQRCAEILEEFPEFMDVGSFLTACDSDELLNCPYDYYQILDYAHRLLKPKSYVEIGVSTGKSLALARTGTCAIGIDPNAANTEDHFYSSPETDPVLFPMTSNEFFRTVNIESLFGVPTFEMAFIDGLHVFEQALMDFVHLESLSGKKSVIFIHDCLPVTTLIAERERQTGFWTGDVWRVVACLKSLRPELEIVTFPARPSGLAMITNLDATSRLLAQQFDSIVAHFISVPLPESFAERCELLNVTNIDPVKFLEERLVATTA